MTNKVVSARRNNSTVNKRDTWLRLFHLIGTTRRHNS